MKVASIARHARCFEGEHRQIAIMISLGKERGRHNSCLRHGHGDSMRILLREGLMKNFILMDEYIIPLGDTRFAFRISKYIILMKK